MFAIVDHASGEAWVDASPRMDRWAAADLLREVTTERFGSVEAAVAAGLALRYDGGPCFRAGHYQAEIDFLGIARSPAYHYEPETNSCVEKFIQTLKEQVLWIERFDTLEQLGVRIRAFARDFNEHWLLERHGYRTRDRPETRSVRRPWQIASFTNQVSGEPGPAQAIERDSAPAKAPVRSLIVAAESSELTGTRVTRTPAGSKRRLITSAPLVQ